VWTLQNTFKSWNHVQEWSIARLMFRTAALTAGDTVVVAILARSDGDAEIELAGDGSKLSDGMRVWARAFPSVKRRLSSPLWKRVEFTSVVGPTEGGQDSAAGGVSIYLRFRTSGSMWIRQSAVYRKRSGTSAAATSGTNEGRIDA
jgi:hypothetical protein